jgi:hypothetical protein
MSSVIRIEPDGHLLAVYSDNLPLANLGELKVSPAPTAEPAGILT